MDKAEREWISQFGLRKKYRVGRPNHWAFYPLISIDFVQIVVLFISLLKSGDTAVESVLLALIFISSCLFIITFRVVRIRAEYLCNMPLDEVQSQVVCYMCALKASALTGREVGFFYDIGSREIISSIVVGGLAEIYSDEDGCKYWLDDEYVINGKIANRDGVGKFHTHPFLRSKLKFSSEDKAYLDIVGEIAVCNPYTNTVLTQTSSGECSVRSVDDFLSKKKM